MPTTHTDVSKQITPLLRLIIEHIQSIFGFTHGVDLFLIHPSMVLTVYFHIHLPSRCSTDTAVISMVVRDAH